MRDLAVIESLDGGKTIRESRNIAWGPGTSAVLDASGAAGAALVINDTAANPWNDPGARTFAFGGSNTDDNTYSGVLANQGANVSSVAKSGTGRWVLSGSNFYTGEIFVNAGTLVAANNRALGAGGFTLDTKTTVADGATLSLQGDISMDEHMHNDDGPKRSHVGGCPRGAGNVGRGCGHR